MTITIPSGFLYSRWIHDIADFLAACGIPGEFGPRSDQAILDRGVSLSCEEFCLPLKLFCGHIVSLSRSGTERILIPVVTGNERGDSFPCHLQQRARDIVINLELIEPDRVVSPRFTYDDSLRLRSDGFLELGRTLGIPETVIGAALKAREKGPAQAKRSRDPTISGQKADGTIDGAIRVAITGTPPVTNDALLGGRIRDMFADLGVETVTPDVQNFTLTDYPKDFRHFTFDALTRVQIDGALRDPAIDGVIFLQAFLCGPCCSTAVDFTQMKRSKPFLPLVIDQGKSTAGTRTRIEAFLEIVKSAKGVTA
jgi:predicted nucleotide-binding protein (sugar kinase/HSP70/actin superfamily)